jgi:RES domain-containing protein
MILIRLGPEVPFYRALTPRWAYQPKSGAGAAAVGGRFNRPGIEARYLAETAGLDPLRPCGLANCAYNMRICHRTSP